MKEVVAEVAEVEEVEEVVEGRLLNRPMSWNWKK
jgi:hypothetical protein